MAPWILASLAAAAFQTLRFLLQKRLSGLGLGAAGATMSRFLFGTPFAWVAVAGLAKFGSDPLPFPDSAFWPPAALGGLAQITATWLTLRLFERRNFAVGIAFTKTEVLIVALFSALFVDEPVVLSGLVAMAVGMTGVLFLSWPRSAQVYGSWDGGAMALGLAAGAGFAISAVCYRAASLTLGDGAALNRAAVTLAIVLTLQSLAMLAALEFSNRGEVGRVLRVWRRTGLVGLTGMLGSFGWFIAFSLQNAAYVRAFGQVELILSILAGWIWLGERLTMRELAGIAILAASLVALLLAV